MNSFIIFLFFLCGTFLKCSPARISTTNKELECFAQERVYHQPTDKCYKLLTTGPCSKGHWFVLEKPKETLRGVQDITIRGTCVREICQEGQYYWKKTNTCVEGKDKNHLCKDPINEELLTNVFGESECACARDPPRIRMKGDKSMQCYPLYTQGPCPRAQVIGYAGKSEQAVCIPDQCFAETLQRRNNRTLSKGAVLAPWEDGNCYELETQGPCPEGYTFKVHSTYMRPVCVSLTNSLFQIEKPRNCFEDEEGRCQKQIKYNKNQTAANYRKELFKRYVAARRRRTTKKTSLRQFEESQRTSNNNEQEEKWIWRDR